MNDNSDLDTLKGNVSLINERINSYIDDTARELKNQKEVIDSTQADVKEILKILKGDGLNILGLVPRVSTLESQMKVVTILVILMIVLLLAGIFLGVLLLK